MPSLDEIFDSLSEESLKSAVKPEPGVNLDPPKVEKKLTLDGVFDEVRKESRNPPNERKDTLTNFAKGVFDTASSAGKQVFNKVGRFRGVAQEGFRTGVESLVSLPFDVADFVVRPALEKAGLVEKGQPSTFESIKGIAKVDEFMSTPIARKLFPVIEDKSSGEKVVSRIFQEVGANAGGALAVLKLARLANKKKGVKIVSALLKNLAKRDPATFIAAESALGVAGGTGAVIATSKFKDSPFADALGSIVGQFSGSLTSSLFKSARKLLPKSAQKIGKEAAEEKVRNELLKSLKNADEAKANAARSEEVSGDINKLANVPEGEGFQPDLAQATGDPRIVERKQTIKQVDEGVNFAEKTSDSNRALNEAIDNIKTSDTIEDTGAVLNENLKAIGSKLKSRASKLTKEVEKQSKNFLPIQGIQTAGKKIREEAQALVAKQRKAEDALFSKVKGKLKIDASDAIKKAEDIIDDLKDKNLQNSIGLGIRNLKDLSESGIATLDEVVGVRRGITDELRFIRSSGTVDFTKAKFLNEALEALDEVLDEAVGVRGNQTARLTKSVNALREANAFVKQGARIFRSGAFKKILQLDDVGGFKIGDSKILPTIFNASSSDPDIADVMIKQFGKNPKAKKIITNHIKESALGVSNEGGASVKSLKTFLSNHSEFLNKFPEAKKEIKELIRKKIKVQKNEKAIGRLNALADSGAVQLFTGQKANSIMKSLLANKVNPKQMGQLISMVKKDPSALRGLRSAFIDEFKIAASTGKDKLTNLPNLAGGKALEFLKKHKDNFDVLYKDAPESKKYIESIAEGANILGRGGKTKVSFKKAAFSNLIEVGNRIARSARLSLIPKAGKLIFLGSAAVDVTKNIFIKDSQKNFELITSKFLIDNGMAKLFNKLEKNPSPQNLRNFRAGVWAALGNQLETEKKEGKK